MQKRITIACYAAALAAFITSLIVRFAGDVRTAGMRKHDNIIRTR